MKNLTVMAKLRLEEGNSFFKNDGTKESERQKMKFFLKEKIKAIITILKKE